MRKPQLVAPSFRRLLPFEDPDDVDTCSVIVMEVRGGAEDWGGVGWGGVGWGGVGWG
jgi:hypothetical protein